MHPFGELGEVEESLRALAARGLVEELPRQPGQKERRWRHLLGSGNVAAPASRESDDPGSLAVAAARPDLEPPAKHATQAEPAVVRAPPPVAAVDPADLASRVSALERRVDELEALVAELLPVRRG
jgi:uncharacterized protein YceH (UPF0502 family)